MKIRGGCPFILQGPQPEVEALHRLDRVWRLDVDIIAKTIGLRKGVSKGVGKVYNPVSQIGKASCRGGESRFEERRTGNESGGKSEGRRNDP